MMASVSSFAKINVGVRIGALRSDGFHELRTVYQTIALHDVVKVFVGRGSGIEIRCSDPRVPCDSTNTCYKIVARVMQAMVALGHVVVEIKKRLPVQGGLGGASGNAVAAMLGLEQTLKKRLPGAQKLRIAAEVGSDLPLFLIGGTVLGVGRGEEGYPLPDLPTMTCVIALPEIAVSTPKAFADWDQTTAEQGLAWSGEGARSHMNRGELTGSGTSDRMSLFSRESSAWLVAKLIRHRKSGVSAKTKSGGRAENPLLDLVRTGIENDFERVVFSQYPELREVKSVLERSGARYASLSGSGSALYGFFDSRETATAAAQKLVARGIRAAVTQTLTRQRYWKKLRAVSD